MARPKGRVSWHESAIRLQTEGASPSEIVATLANLPAPPSLAAVRKFLSRAKADPVRSMQAMATSPKIAPIEAQLTYDDNRTLVEIFIALEKRRARVLTKALIEAEEYLDTPHRNIEKSQNMKFFGAVELLKALKAPGTTADLDKAAMGNADIRDIRVEVVRVERNDASPSP